MNGQEPEPQDLYDVAKRVTEETFGPGSWKDPREHLLAYATRCKECGTTVLVLWGDEPPQSCAEHT